MNIIRPYYVRSAILTVATCLSVSLGAAEEKKIVQLENSDGKIITAELLEKSEDQVKVKMGLNIYTLPISKLSKDSAEIVKNAKLPAICNFKLAVDINKVGTKVSQDRQEQQQDAEGSTYTITLTDSYRVDTITGKVTVTNLDNENPSPTAKLYVVVLANGNEDNQVIQRQIFDVNPIGRIGESKFDVQESKTLHSPRGMDMMADGFRGRYSGYIAAIVIDGHILEIKSNSPNFEKDIESARKLLEIAN